jgi:integration host factor subunit alpha
MTLTRADIVKEIRSRTGFRQVQSVDTLGTLLEIIKRSLASGEDVLISGFGKFCVKDKRERRGRNPATGGDVMLRARRIVTFKCSGKLRDRVNGGNK